MPSDTGYVRPTLAALISRISSDLNSRLPGQDARIRRSVLWVLARVLAGAVHLLYGFASWIARQILPDTADGDRLRRHAAIWQIDPLTATEAAGNVLFSGVPATAIPIGSALQRADGAEYETTAGAVVGGGGTVVVRVIALLAGEAGNCDAATILELVSPIAGVTSASVVEASPDNVAGGTDDESNDELRDRLLAYIAERPQGGARSDYETWAREVAAVDRVFVSPLELGPGTVVVRFSIEGTGAAVIPGAGKVAEVQAYIDPRAPVTADVTVLAPVALPITLTIHVVPDTAAIRAAVSAELEDLFAREAEPGGTIPNSHLREAIARAEGETSHTLTAVGGGAGTADVVQAATELAHLSTITWV